MARKIFCDGCGEEVDYATVLDIAFSVTAGAQEIKSEKQDVCASCLSHFRSSSLPSRWPRVGNTEPRHDK